MWSGKRHAIVCDRYTEGETGCKRAGGGPTGRPALRRLPPRALAARPLLGGRLSLVLLVRTTHISSAHEAVMTSTHARTAVAAAFAPLPTAVLQQGWGHPAQKAEWLLHTTVAGGDRRQRRGHARHRPLRGVDLDASTPCMRTSWAQVLAPSLGC